MNPKKVSLLLLVTVRWMAVGLFALAGCSSPSSGVYGPAKPQAAYTPMKDLKPGEFFKSELQTTSKEFAASDIIKSESAKIDNSYRLGPGDRFAFLVRGREDISREEVIVSPDGEVSLPRVGIVNVKGKTIAEATATFRGCLQSYYDSPEVTMAMKSYNNNRVFVLGRVANPGAVNFQGPGSLLEALSLAGGLPADQSKSFLSRCMIVRGTGLVMWIDLKELLERGNMALNARLQNGDVIFIPQSEDQLAYVLGEVRTPGVVPLRSELTLLDAVMNAGGPGVNANLKDIFLVRQSQGKGVVERIDFREIINHGDFRKNYVLRDGDLIYIPQTGLGKLNYFMTQLAPFFTTAGVTANTISNVDSLYTTGLFSGSSTASGR